MSIQETVRRMEADPELLRANWCLPPEAARFMYLVTRIGGFRQIVEVGTSIGYSTLHFAWAASQQEGHVTTIDASAERQEEARRNIAQAGLAPQVTFITGDALESLGQLKASGARFDLAFLDARKSEYRAYLNLLEAMLSPGSVLIADNTRSHRDEMSDFIDEIKVSNRWESCDVETPNGFILARMRQ